MNRGGHSSIPWAELHILFKGVLCMAAILVLIPGTCLGQVLYGSLVGNVNDPSGAAVPGATVKVTQQETGLVRSGVTDSSGTYIISTLQAGTYEVKISASGFKAFNKSGVKVVINNVARVDASLEVGALNQTVEVSATAVALQTDRPDVHHELTAKTIEDVPMPPGNNFEELFRAVPGFNPPVSAHSVATNPSRSLQFNVNGASSYGNDVRIDGMSQYNIWVPENAAYIPSADAIEVVNVATNSFNPEQGLAGGSSINVQVRSGTNQFHGDVYEYHYDNGIEARPFFLYGRNPKDIFNQFGGSVGGPIKKDKLFFFSNLEATRQRQFATSFATVPTAAMRGGDLRGLDLSKSNPDTVYDPATGNSDGTGRTQFSCNGAANTICPDRFSPVAVKMLSMLPLPNNPNASSNVPSNNFLGAADIAFNRLTSDSKINWNATNKFSMFGHLGLAKFNTYNPQIFDPIGGPQASGFIGNEGTANGHTISFSATANYVASPNFVVDGSVGMTRMVVNSQQLDVSKNEGLDVLGIPGTNGTRKFEGSWPEFDISNFSVIGTQHNFMPYFRNDPQFNYSSNASWIKGRHTIRFGADIISQHLNEQQPEWNGGGSSYGPQGGFAFGAGPTQCKGCVSAGKTTPSNAYNSFATFLLGLNTAYGRNIQIPDFFHTITHEWGFYGGDQWQVNNKLTATLGLRWEYFPIPTRGGSRGLERFDFSNYETMICGVGGIPTDCRTSISKNNFAPRIGLAYRATNTLVVRAAYGITYEPYNLVDDLRTNYPILIPLYVSSPSSLFASGAMDSTSLANTPVGQCTAFSQSCSGGALPVGIPSPANPDLTAGEIPIPGNVAAVTAGDSVHRGYIQTWNFTVEKEIRGGWLAQAGYVASRTVNQLGILNLNVGSPVAPAGCVPGKCGGNASLPFDFNSVTQGACNGTTDPSVGCRTAATSIVTPITNNHYDSLQASLTHHFANGYQVQFNYTWSKTIGMAGVENEKNSPSIQTPQFFYLNRGLSPINRPQNFEAVFIAESPFGAKKRWVNSGFGAKVLGGWRFSGLLSAVSGSVVSLSADGSSLNASGNTQRPDIVGTSNMVTGKVGPGTTWLNTADFAGVTGSPLGITDQRFGSSPFYPLLGPGVFNLDLALIRNFRLSERFNFELRAQAINSTNTAHFSNPNGSCGSYSASTGCSSTSFGQITSVTNLARDGIDQRQFEISMKLDF